MMSFEDRCLQKIRELNLTVLRESVEEQVAKISEGKTCVVKKTEGTFPISINKNRLK